MSDYLPRAISIHICDLKLVMLEGTFRKKTNIGLYLQQFNYITIVGT